MARLVKYDAPGAILKPTAETINGFEQLIRWAEVETPARLRTEMNKLTRMMAIINQGEARLLSFGPSDPFQTNSGAAWKLPVRRITGRYYLSWKVAKLGQARWMLYNDSREAYYIEFGISQVGWGSNRHVPARRIRRPVRKLSLRRTLIMMQTTHAYHRVWANIYTEGGRTVRGRGFSQIVQSPGVNYPREAITAAGVIPMMGRTNA